ncbi:ABC transporter ATP-binding protein [Amphibiibacter pelophylacis]|uniref:ABC transporter ATP-binding protein n=1 Tax=Amphibiibacter pelophylacis TaxID=1799477 RepID=A0ACC6P455_9BURK
MTSFATSSDSASGLQAHAVGVHFQGLKALSGVDLTLQRGRITGLIGPNGAGKTTLVNVLSGFQVPHEGEVRLDGQSLRSLSADALRRWGVARTFQGGRLFANLTVQENLEAAGVGLGQNRAQARREAQALLDEMQVGALAPLRAADLPYTDERRVSIARALMGRPRYLLLDEPAAGMSDPEAHELDALVRHLVERVGCGVLLIEHNIRLVLGLCDEVVVLDSGCVIAQGLPDEIHRNERVREAYMGSMAAAVDEDRASSAASPRSAGAAA